MLTLRTIISLALLALVTSMNAQSVKELEQKLEAAENTAERQFYRMQLAKSLIGKDNKRSVDLARKAYHTAIDKNNNSQAARAAFLVGRAYQRKRDLRNAEVWYKSTLVYAKKAKDSDLIIKSVNERSKLATKKRDYRKAYRINQEAFDYFSQAGTSMSDLESNFESQQVEIQRATRKLAKEKEALEKEINRLEGEKRQLSSDKRNLTKKQEELVQEFTAQEAELEDLSEAKIKAESRVRRKEEEIENLNKEALKQKVLLQDKELELAQAGMELAQADLEQERSRNILTLLSLASLFIVVLAILFFARYLSKKKSAKVLEDKNKMIAEEQKRSDELLLNILPAEIAEELKEQGKASARKYANATVLITDFKNFTTIAERLSPEQLVKELDYCFRAFDFIISQYDIEKIKTIGDAYMCASGLTNRKTIPTQIVKAALEMQEFLEDYKQERSRLSLPFFEARIGIHTGPVVAGVVGVNKFAYDIWGDTVNIASRMESNCEEGKVNISASTYGLIRYKFDCHYRGKVAAKNKGEIDMYYVSKAV